MNIWILYINSLLAKNKKIISYIVKMFVNDTVPRKADFFTFNKIRENGFQWYKSPRNKISLNKIFIKNVFKKYNFKIAV